MTLHRADAVRRLMRWARCSVANLLLGVALAVLVFDIFTVRPCVARIEQVIATAHPDERNPSAALQEMIHRAHGDRLEGLVARDAVLSSMRGGERMQTLPRVLTEAGVAMLLPWHLSEAQLETAYLASSFMGTGVRGFAAASARHLGTHLALVDLRQAAHLMAIAHAPSFSLQNPQRLGQRVLWLLSRPSSTGQP
ncbi:transglycosylase domain-containing protein [Roseateles sp. DC23W]|uniref:Transglycosylase domain-containing protein n=1 Tax=Pelomonas dachongensis TaxID=3299029 RepID=A0ABW7EGD6_9BURK